MSSASSTTESWDVQWIMSILPHRYPLLLVDRVLKIVPGERLVAIKNITINEEYFVGHFPDHPVVPGVLLIEGMAQAGGILLLADMPEAERQDKVPYFTSIDRARFRRPVVPGDQVRYEIEILQRRRNIGRLSAKAMVGDAVAAEATLGSAMVDRD